MMRHNRFLRTFAIGCALALATLLTNLASSQAEHVNFYIDSSNSYLTLAIPNFTFANTTINVLGQNRTNGAPLTTNWGTTTGNTAFLSGSFATTIGGNFQGGVINSVQFIAGSSTITALNSGNYRPNPAALNTSAVPAIFNNNTPHPGNFGGTLHTMLGNAAYFNLSNTDLALENTAPISVAGNQFPVNLLGNSLTTGFSSTMLSLQGGSLLLLGVLIPGQVNTLTGLTAANTATGNAEFVYAPANAFAKLTIPVSFPFAIPLGDGTFINGTAMGKVVALSELTPEPSTCVLAGMGFIVWLAVMRRRGAARRTEL